MGRKERTEEELRKASEHLCYEIWMLQAVARELLSGRVGQRVLNNALIESFAIHTRNLLDFLYSGNPWEDDVIAEDFFPPAEDWAKERPEKSELLGKIHGRVGKEVAHLTYGRLYVTREAKKWDFRTIADDINKTFERFLAIVPKHLLGDRWESYKRKFDEASEG